MVKGGDFFLEQQAYTIAVRFSGVAVLKIKIISRV
jgi:hypothetical protein